MIYHGCPKCGEALASPDSLVGSAETCPACGNITTVPRIAPVAVATAPAYPVPAVRPMDDEREERTLWVGRPSRWHYSGWYGLAIVLSLLGTFFLIPGIANPDDETRPLLLVGVCLVGSAAATFLGCIVARLGTIYRVTTRRVMARYGILSRRERMVPIGPIREVTLRQSIGGRLLGIGTVGFSTAASTAVEVQFRGIPEPVRVQRLVQERMRQ